jgi:hypothetical protein
MAKKASFNFGANAPKPKAARKARKGGRSGGSVKSGGNAWRAYTSHQVSNAPLPP